MKKRSAKKGVLEILLEVSRKTSSSLNIEEVGSLIVKHAKAFVKADYSALFLLREKSEHLILIGASGFRKNEIKNLSILENWEDINKEVVKKKKAIIVDNINKNVAFVKKHISPLKGDFPIGAFLAVPLKKGNKVIGILVVSHNKKKKVRFTEQDKKLLHTLTNHVSMALLNAKLYDDLQSLFLNTVDSLASAIDARDKYTHGHSRRVAQYAVAIAKKLGCDPIFVGDIKLSGLLHDVGKIGLRDHILSKNGPLNDAEMEKVEEHPIIGSEIVDSVIKSTGILKGIQEHHEHFDGTGYPRKLKKDKISLEGSIIAVADAFDALTTNRPYQVAFSAKEAALEIVRSSKTHFSPTVVKAFQKSFSENPDFWHFK